MIVCVSVLARVRVSELRRVYSIPLAWTSNSYDNDDDEENQ